MAGGITPNCDKAGMRSPGSRSMFRHLAAEWGFGPLQRPRFVGKRAFIYCRSGAKAAFPKAHWRLYPSECIAPAPPGVFLIDCSLATFGRSSEVAALVA